MRSIIISAEGSSSGKTTITLGIMKALIKKGYEVQGYKVGPDYIDPAFHRRVTGKPSRNLDIFLMGEAGVKASYMRGCGDIGIIEGVMGLYDGKGIDTDYSTAHLSKLLGLPVILVISPKGRSTTVCAEINGMVNFDDVNIAGIVFNNISESYYKLLKAAVKKNCSVQVFGYIPKDERLSLKNRHLGLIQSSEISDLDNKIEIASELVLKNIDIDNMLKYFKNAGTFKDGFHVENRKIKIAAAYDKAFSFYYEENLEILKEMGQVVFFSPIKDKKLPDDIDFLYIGGGYPEVFIEELSKNKSMLHSIREKLNSGLKCYAECGGLMYLMENIDGFETVGFFNGCAEMTDRLQNFGYASLEVTDNNHIFKKGLKINCHEFHKSCVESREKKIYSLTKELYDGSTKKWKCGYLKKNTIGGYAHVHFFSNMSFINSMVNSNDGGE